MKHSVSLLRGIPATSQPTRAAATGKPRLRSLVPVLAGLLLLIAPAWAQKFDWTRKIANTTGKTAVVTDKAGNSYALTSFSGTLAIANSSLASYGGTDLLLIKYKPDGSVDWLRRIAGTGNEQAGDLVLSADEKNVYVTGSFHNTVKFESGGKGVSPLASAGQSDGFVASFYTGAGSFGWARRFGGTGNDYGNGVAVDPAENVYLTGSFTGEMKFSLPLGTTSVKSAGMSDAFLVKYNAGGAFLLVRRLGGIGYDLGTALVVDPDTRNVYLTGGFSPGAAPYVTDVLVAGYTSGGTLKWAKSAGQANQADLGNDITLSFGGIGVTGYFGGTIKFDGETVTSKGSADIFVAYYPFYNNGKAKAAYGAGGTGWDEGQSIAYTTYQRQPQEGSIGNLYVGGVFNGTAAFGYDKITAKSGGQDMFLAEATTGTFGTAVALGSYGHDSGRGGLAMADANTVLYTGQYGSPIYLGYPTLSGPGSLLTKITLPTVTGLQLVNAATDTDLQTLKHFDTINYVTLGNKQINIRANTRTGSAGSVLLRLDGMSLIRDSSLPFTLGGDMPKAGGGYDYLPLSLAAGSYYRLEVVPYSGPNGTGIAGSPLDYTFFVADKPVVNSLMLVNAVTDAFFVNLDKGATLYYSKLGTNQVSIMANVHYGLTRSVKFSLDGVQYLSNKSPYAIAGASPKTGGGFDFLPITLKAGTHHLVVTAYGGTNATGLASDPYQMTFTVIADKALRVAAGESEPEKPLAAFTVAPNPFSGQTSLLFTPREDGEVSVEVFSPQGVRLQQVYRGVVQAGKPYAWAFNAQSLPAGVYIGQVRMGAQVLHQKMVLSR